ncbi:hypothetical protein KP79_PYT19855 [Mizuhopecten yessoensis]|uniref:Uncharacterized protein n=1 Tax=Mizuhopecten yessoensis TaxID=6573 RepID=A0A210PSJ6_MIZYE|nr:hypothetical protein KP79_PYT19855 [Mizuhopecten yessoensis]
MSSRFVSSDGNAPKELCPSNDWNSASDYNTTGTTAAITLSTDGSDQYQGFVMSYMRTGCLITTTGTTETTTDVTTETTVTTVQATSTTTTPGITTVTETQSSTTVTQTTINITNMNSAATEQDEYHIVAILVVPLNVCGSIVVIVIKKRKETSVDPEVPSTE